eukprot:c10879_g1_i1.p1 GENE.c10879_g1_i1~~c10879_g1_i1.p1  ORF type:complete len:241 (+),score=62.36 c10879_g1_i1:71-793(+)
MEDNYIGQNVEFQPLVKNQNQFTSISPESLRAGLIRKVYGLLSLQILCTIAVSVLFVFVDDVRNFVITYHSVSFIAMFAPFIFIAILSVKPAYPTNLIVLGLFTLSISYSLGAVSILYATRGDGIIILEALALTMAVFVSLSAYVLITKKDFNFLGGFLYSSLLILIFWGLIQIFFPMSQTFQAVKALIGAFVFCGFILFDTSRIVHIYSPDEYIEATLELYLDIVNLFLEILKLLSKDR